MSVGCPELNKPAKSGKVSCLEKNLDGHYPVSISYNKETTTREEDGAQRWISGSAEPTNVPAHPLQRFGLQNVASPPMSGRDTEKNDKRKEPETGRINNVRQQQKISHPQVIPLYCEAACSALGSNSPTDPHPVSALSSLFRKIFRFTHLWDLFLIYMYVLYTYKIYTLEKLCFCPTQYLLTV